LPEPNVRATSLLAACAAASVAILAGAIAMQYGFGKQPCAWCVLQRLIFLLIAVVCGLGAMLPRARIAQIGAALTADALATAGAAAALYLHFVASQTDSCGLSLADKVIISLSLHETVPWMFFADAPCNEGNPVVLGVPFALWSFAGFAVVGAGAVMALVVLLRQGRGRSGV
jgi:disulfide bond formation protein DsbB